MQRVLFKLIKLIELILYGFVYDCGIWLVVAYVFVSVTYIQYNFGVEYVFFVSKQLYRETVGRGA